MTSVLIVLTSHPCTCVLHRQGSQLHTLKLPKFFHFHGDFHQKWHFAHPKISFAHPELPFLAKSMSVLDLWHKYNPWYLTMCHHFKVKRSKFKVTSVVQRFCCVWAMILCLFDWFAWYVSKQHQNIHQIQQNIPQMHLTPYTPTLKTKQQNHQKGRGEGNEMSETINPQCLKSIFSWYLKNLHNLDIKL